MKELDLPVRTGTLRSQVVEILRNAIFYGKLQPGSLLRELALARSLQVSQSTVREALADLEQYGLVTRQGNRGTMVATLGADEIRQRMKVRIPLEELAFAEACPQLTGEDFDVLEGLTAEIALAISNCEYFKAAEADLAFHRHVWERAGNPILLRTLDLLVAPLFAFLSVLLKMTNTERLTTEPHSLLVKGLRTRDVELARESIRAHLEHAAILMLEARAEPAPNHGVWTASR